MIRGFRNSSYFCLQEGCNTFIMIALRITKKQLFLNIKNRDHFPYPEK